MLNAYLAYLKMQEDFTLAEIIQFIQRAVKSQFTGKIELNFMKGTFKVNILRTNVESIDLVNISM